MVHLYVDLALGSDSRPLGTLRAFGRVTIAPGATETVRFRLESAWRRIHVGPSADPRTWQTVTR